MADYIAQCSSNQYITLLLRTQVVSQDVSGNTTTLNWSLHVLKSGASTSATWGTCSYGATINGNAYSNSGQVRVEAGGDTTILYGTTVIPHNADGTKTVSLSASISGKIVGSLSASETLATIPRASSLSVSGGTMGSPMTLTINAASSAFTHSLTYAFGSASGTILSYVGAGAHSWTPPLSLANQVPNATSGWGTLTLYTWGNGVEIGRNSYTFTLSVPSSVVPSISSVTAAEATSGLADQFGAYVQGKSTLKVITSAAGSYGSTIKSCVISVDGKTYSGNSITTSTLTASGNLTLTATVTDSRGRTASKSITISVQPYANPAITALSVWRCTADGVADDSGDYVSITYAYTIASVNSKNNATSKIEYKRTTLTEWAELMTGNDYAVNTTVYPDQELLSDYRWDIRLTVSDYFGSTAMTVTLPSAEVILDLMANGKGLAIGKTAELEDTLDVKWAARFLGDVRFDGPVSTPGFSVDAQGNTTFDGPVSTPGFSVDSHGNYNARANTDLIQLFIRGVQLTDFVTAQGISGSWTYRKWNSGVAECWGIFRVTFANTFVLDTVATLPFSFPSVTAVLGTLNDMGGNAANALPWNAKAQMPNPAQVQLVLHNPNGGFDGTSVTNVSAYVLGRWK